MNEQEVRQLIQNGESSKVEFKSEDVHPVSLADEIVAFANFEGGTIHELMAEMMLLRFTHPVDYQTH